MEKILHQFLAWLLDVAIQLTPAALGAAVSVAVETGLTWSRALIQVAVGMTISHFATRVAGAIWPALDPFVLDGVGFVMGMIAFKAAPPFIAAASTAIAAVPQLAVDRIVGRKGDTK